MVFLTRKLGPLPAWGWAVAAVGGFMAYRYLKSRQASQANSSAGQIPISSPNLDANLPPWDTGMGGFDLPVSSVPISAASDTSGTSSDSSSGGQATAPSTSSTTSSNAPAFGNLGSSQTGSNTTGGQHRIHL